jgi:predicted MPP superfamily phosphohydrolase
LGKYGVLGNHDHWESADECKKEAKNADIELVDNRSKWIQKDGERIKIGGVGDLTEDIQNITPTIEDVEIKDFVILLSHHPDYVESIQKDKIDLVLSGHTHGGQCTVFGLWAPLVPSKFGNKYRTGMLEIDNTTLIVTNGIGTVTPPVRFFARPQIDIIYLKKK